jgi:hypothetical protein
MVATEAGGEKNGERMVRGNKISDMRSIELYCTIQKIQLTVLHFKTAKSKFQMFSALKMVFGAQLNYPLLY